MILGFAHPAIVVRDLDRATEFYCSAFGFRPLSEAFESWSNAPHIDAATGLRGSSVRGRMLAGHNCFLELFQFDAPATKGPEPAQLGAHEPGIRHISFFVDDVEVEFDRVVTLGELADIRLTYEDREGTARFNGDTTIAFRRCSGFTECLSQSSSTTRSIRRPSFERSFT